MKRAPDETVEGLFGLPIVLHRWNAAKPRGLALMLHGFLDAGLTWDLCAPMLVAQGYTVVAPDQRGFGDSGHVGTGGYYHFPDYIADAVRFVAHLRSDTTLRDVPLHLVGHSMGGTVAALYAATAEDSPRTLSLLEGIGPPALGPEVAVVRVKRWLADLSRLDRTPRTLADLDDAVRRLRVHHARVPEDVLRSRATLLSKSTAEGLVWKYDPLHRTTSPSGFRVDQFCAFLNAIDVPTLWVSGGSHGYHPSDEAERLAHLKKLTQEELPDAGHMMHWTAPDELSALLIEHFERG